MQVFYNNMHFIMKLMVKERIDNKVIMKWKYMPIFLIDILEKGMIRKGKTVWRFQIIIYIMKKKSILLQI